jgi:hypothetical protein
VRYVDDNTKRIVNKRKRQVANNNWFPIEEPGRYKKVSVSGHRHSCFMCSGRRAKRRLLMALDISEELE